MQHPREVLEHVHAFITAQGFFYPKQAIANLYLSLKTKPFVILAGVSGTGKTQLVRQFAAALGHGDRCHLLPVQPEWQDHSDLLGYTDLQGNFVIRPFLDILLKAKAEPDKPRFIILDEMNLARVEYYLSDILSILETRRWTGSQIITDPIFHSHSFPKLNPSNEHLPGLVLPDNLYLIGTVNVDETTHRFSRKVLDRVNVIEMNEVYLDLPLVAEPIEPLQAVDNELLRTPFLQLTDIPTEGYGTLEKPLRWLIDIHEILQTADQPLGYRLRDEVLFYMYHRLAIRELISEAEAFDRQICQKILPRLQGHSHRTVQAVYELIRLLVGKEELPANLLSYRDLEQQLIPFTQARNTFRYSIQKLMVMYRRFEEDGYISYWM